MVEEEVWGHTKKCSCRYGLTAAIVNEAFLKYGKPNGIGKPMPPTTCAYKEPASHCRCYCLAQQTIVICTPKPSMSWRRRFHREKLHSLLEHEKLLWDPAWSADTQHLLLHLRET